MGFLKPKKPKHDRKNGELDPNENRVTAPGYESEALAGARQAATRNNPIGTKDLNTSKNLPSVPSTNDRIAGAHQQAPVQSMVDGRSGDGGHGDPPLRRRDKIKKRFGNSGLILPESDPLPPVVTHRDGGIDGAGSLLNIHDQVTRPHDDSNPERPSAPEDMVANPHHSPTQNHNQGHGSDYRTHEPDVAVFPDPDPNLESANPFDNDAAEDEDSESGRVIPVGGPSVTNQRTRLRLEDQYSKIESEGGRLGKNQPSKQARSTEEDHRNLGRPRSGLEEIDRDAYIQKLKTRHEEDLNKIQDELYWTQEDLRNDRNTLASTQTEYYKVQNERDVAQSDLANARSDLRLTRDELSTAQSNWYKLNDQLGPAQGSLALAQSDLYKARSANKTLQTELRQTEQQLVSMQQSVDQTRLEAGQITSQRDAARSELNRQKSLFEQTKNMQGRIRELENALKEAEEERDAAKVEAFDCKEEMGRLRAFHGEELSRQQAEHQANLNQKDRELYNSGVIIENKDQEIVRHQTRIHEDGQTHLRNVQELRNTHKVDRDDLVRQKDSELKAQTQKTQDAINNLKKEHIRNTASMDLQHREEKDTLVATHKQRLQAEKDTARGIQDGLRNQVTQLEKRRIDRDKEHVKEMQDQEQEHERELADEKAKYEAQMTERVREHTLAISTMTREIQDKEQQLTTEFAQKTRSLRQEVTELSTALIARDNDAWTATQFSVADLRKEPDEHISEDFGQIEQLIGNLAGLKWKNSQSVWPDQLLRQLDTGCGQRRLKQSILKNQIWETLHEFIFGSPFRLFGDEGLKLERQWSERCGSGVQSEDDEDYYSWPAPQVETERWRYITVRECRLALIEPISSEHDPRYKVRKGFKTNTDALAKQLKSYLGEIVELQSSNSETIERLVKRMSNVWLEFGMHRCRISISLQKSNIELIGSKMRGPVGKPVVLNTAPGLGRYGNMKGVELETYTTIGKRTGETMKLS